MNSDLTNETTPPSAVFNNFNTSSNLQPVYQTTPIVSFEAKPDDVLLNQNEFVISDNIEKKEFRVIFPKIDSLSKGTQDIYFNFETREFTRPNEMLLSFSLPITGKSIDSFEDNLGFIDNPLASTKIQAPYAFLNSLNFVEAHIGDIQYKQTLDEKIFYDIRALKTIMCHNPRTQSRHKTMLSCGLPSQMTTFIHKFEANDYQNHYDKPLYDYFMSTYFFDNGNPVPFSTFYQCSLYLCELFPFLDTDMLFPPNVKFSFRFRFEANSPERLAIFNSQLGLPTSADPTLANLSGLTLDNSRESFPIFNTNGSTTIHYTGYILNENLTRDLNLKPYYMYNTWAYEYHNKFFSNSPLEYDITIPNAIVPSRIFFYFTLPKDTYYIVYPSVDSPTSLPDIFLYGDGNCYFTGYKIKTLDVSFNGESKIHIDDTKLQSDLNTQNQFFVSNTSPFDYIMNLDDEKNWPNDCARLVTQKLGPLENFIPHALNLSPTLINTNSITTMNQSVTNLTLRVKFKHSFACTTTTINDLLTYNDTLPPNITINVLLQYPIQYLLQNRQLTFATKNRYISNLGLPQAIQTFNG